MSWRDALLEVYNRLPPGARSIAASARGARLRAWRYGPETERLVAEALERDTWSAERWRAYQEDRLAVLLERAAQRVPYYRALWSERRRRGDRRPWDVLEHWPVLDKAAVRRDPRSFVADDCRRGAMFHEHTSGTTGTPIELWFRRETVHQWYALFEARWRRWNGVTLHDRWAIFGGQLVTPIRQGAPPYWVWNGPLSQLYCSSYHLRADAIPAYVEALERYEIVYLWGYSSALYALAQGILRLGRRPPALRVVVTNAEPLYPHQRRAMEDAFAAPVRETYGMSEIVAAAAQCDHGALHLWPDAGVVEVLDDGAAARPGATGDLVCTGLLNTDMPLIRYLVGDRGAVLADRSCCGCGRMLPVLGALDGRADDELVTRDGRRVGRLDPVFKASIPLVEAQLIQESEEAVRLRFVPASGFSADHERELIARIRDRLGQVTVRLERVDTIPRGSNGKFRAVINEMRARASGSETAP